MDDTKEVIAALKQRFPTIAGPELRDICYATQNRQNAVRTLAERGLPAMLDGGHEVRIARFVSSGEIPGLLGKCTKFNGWKGRDVVDYNVIDIASDMATADTLDLRLVVGHELGHCWFGLGHNANKYGDIMGVALPKVRGREDIFNMLEESLVSAIERKLALGE